MRWTALQALTKQPVREVIMAEEECIPSVAVCRICLEQKPVGMFYPSARRKSGREGQCKSCKIALNSKSQAGAKSKARRALAHKKRWVESEEYRQARVKAANEYSSRPDVKARYAQRSKARRLADPEHTRRLAKQQYERQKLNPVFLLAARIRSGVRKAIAGGQRTNKTFEMLGYSPLDLVRHMELQFVNGMSWENFGRWHIDHIVPLAHLRPSSEAEIAAAWALSNLRPLWSEENMKKHAKVLHLV